MAPQMMRQLRVQLWLNRQAKKVAKRIFTLFKGWFDNERAWVEIEV
jgi:hypothetical protein